MPRMTFSVGAVKARFLGTEIKAGDVFPATPVVHFGDARLLPESFKGVTVVNNSLDDLTLQGGRLHAMSQPNTSNMNEDFVTFYGGVSTRLGATQAATTA